ncbi:hypothetical protein [Ovoidimarina sediminis]|uniref:hypothetical protein n=1 Tax=Ovoidimarina sediminis TaxID=3079856 RepID=UPI002914E878|nr:hypothetical protein [Rhodophyticola sp. MJ-SS7]MDU8945869.1 hypothetical protein [Rhodophyticola sp. MJ-SS7]
MALGTVISFLIGAALVSYPFSRILPRVGLNPWISLIGATWIGALVLLWIVAFRDWREA